MRKTTLNLGVISSGIFIIGVLLKWQHWPGAGIALCVSVMLFSAGYAPLLYIDKNKQSADSKQKFFNLLIMLAMIIVSVTFMLKAMHWPGAGIGIIIGNFTLIALVPFLFSRALKETDPNKRLNYYNEAVILMFFLGFSLFIWLVMGQNP